MASRETRKTSCRRLATILVQSSVRHLAKRSCRCGRTWTLAYQTQRSSKKRSLWRTRNAAVNATAHLRISVVVTVLLLFCCELRRLLTLFHHMERMDRFMFRHETHILDHQRNQRRIIYSRPPCGIVETRVHLPPPSNQGDLHLRLGHLAHPNSLCQRTQGTRELPVSESQPYQLVPHKTITHLIPHEASRIHGTLAVHLKVLRTEEAGLRAYCTLPRGTFFQVLPLLQQVLLLLLILRQFHFRQVVILRLVQNMEIGDQSCLIHHLHHQWDWRSLTHMRHRCHRWPPTDLDHQ